MKLISVHVLKNSAEHVLNRAKKFPLSLIHGLHHANICHKSTLPIPWNRTGAGSMNIEGKTVSCLPPNVLEPRLVLNTSSNPKVVVPNDFLFEHPKWDAVHEVKRVMLCVVSDIIVPCGILDPPKFARG